MVASFRKTWDTVKEVLDNVNKGFREIVPPLTGERLADFTGKVYLASKALKEFNDKHMDDFLNIGRGVGGIVSLIMQGVGKLTEFITGSISSLSGDEGILDLIIKGLGDLGNRISEFSFKVKDVGFFRALTDELKELWKALPTFLSGFSDRVVQAFGRFAKYFKDLTGIDLQSGPFKIIGDVFKTIGSVISGTFPEGFKSVGDTFSSIFGVVNAGAVKVFEWFSNVLSDIGNTIDKSFGWLIQGVGTALQWLGKGIQKVVEYIGKLNIVDLMKLVFIIEKIGKVLRPVNNVINRTGQDLPSIFEHISDAFENMDYVLERGGIWIDYFITKAHDITNVVNATSFMEIAAGFLLIAGAIKVVGDLKPDQIEQALGGLIGLLVTMTAVMKGLSKYSTGIKYDKKKGIFGNLFDMFGKSGNQRSLAAGVLAISAAMVIFAAAMKILSTVDWPGIAKGLVSIGGILVELWAFFTVKMKINAGKDATLNGIGDAKASIGLIAGIIAIANAMILLAVAMKIISTIDVPGIAKGLVSIGVLLVAIYEFFTHLKGTSGLVNVSGGKVSTKSGTNASNFGIFAGVFLLATSMVILAAAMKIIETMDVTAIAKGLGTILGLMAIVVGGMFALGKLVEGQGMNLMMTAGAIQTVALAMLTLAAGVLLLSMIQDTDKINTALGIMAGSLVAIWLFFKAIDKINPIAMIGGAAGFALIAAGLVLIAGALLIVTSVATMPGFQDAQNILLGAFVVLAATVAALALLNKSGEMALAGAAMVLMAASMTILAVALNILAGTDAGKAVEGLMALAVTLVVLGAAASILAGLWGVMLPGAGIMLALGAAAIVLSIGLTMLGEALSALAKGLEAVIKLLLNIWIAFMNLEIIIWNGLTGAHSKTISMAEVWGEETVDAYGEGLITGAKETDAPEEMMDAINNKITENGGVASSGGRHFVETFADSIGDGEDEVLSVVDELNSRINANLGNYDVETADILDPYMQQLKDDFPEVDDLTSQYGEITLDNIVGDADLYRDGGEDNVDAYLSAFTSSYMKTESKSATTQFMNTITKDLNADKKSVDIGKTIALGIGNGLLDRVAVNMAKGNAGTLIDTLFNVMKKKAKSASPSKRARDEVGKTLPLGVAAGIRKYAVVSTTAAGEMMDGVFDSLSDAIGNTDRMFANNLTLDPTITPLMDLSQIQNGADRINSLLGGQSFRINGALGTLSMANNDIMASLAASLANKDKSSDKVVGAINSLKGDVKTLGEHIDGLEIRMDSGALVGSIARPMDKQLGIRAVRNRRERP